MDKENFVKLHILGCNDRISAMIILIHIILLIQSLLLRDAFTYLI